MVDRYALSEWLREQLIARDWSQADLARAAGIGRAIISKTINQISDPTPDTIKAIAHGLDIPASEIFRVAKIFDDSPIESQAVDRINYLVNEMDDDTLEELLEYGRYLLERKEKQTAPHKRGAEMLKTE